MKQAITALAFLSSAVSFLLLGGGGGALVVIASSGERATGALLAFCGAVAFACVDGARLRSCRARSRSRLGAPARSRPRSSGRCRRRVLPPRLSASRVCLLRSAMPLVDWSIFLGGVFFVLGALSILALGLLRARTPAAAASEVIHMQQIRDAQLQLRTAFEKRHDATPSFDDDEEVRVRRVYEERLGGGVVRRRRRGHVTELLGLDVGRIVARVRAPAAARPAKTTRRSRARSSGQGRSRSSSVLLPPKPQETSRLAALMTGIEPKARQLARRAQRVSQA